MPVTLRSNKRRSLHITHNVKLADITKEALSRPRSWYLSGTNTEGTDPYTSVRKLFYDFNKQAFYGDNNHGKENNRDNNQLIITNGHSKLTPPTEHPTREHNALLQQKNTRNSSRKLGLKSPSSFTTTSSTGKPNDKNNNAVTTTTTTPATTTTASITDPLPISPPKVPVTPYKPPNFIQSARQTVFSSKPSDTASLKEESSSYADFYVPSSVPGKSSSHFLRRTKRRSNDSSKFSAFDYVTRISKDDDIMSVVSSASKYSTKAASMTSPLSSPLSVHDEELVDPQPMIERYLRDANKDICAGIYPAADPSLTIQEGEFDSDDSRKNKKKRNLSFVPWNKRWTFIEATYSPDEEATTFYESTYKSTNSTGRFSSFRRSVKSRNSSIGNNSQKSSPKKSTLRRMNSLGWDTHRSNPGTVSTLRRHHSEKHPKRKMSNMSIKSSQNNDVIVTTPLIKNNDLPRNLKARKSGRFSKVGYETRCFFDRYQDNLRVEMFSIKMPSTTSTFSSTASYADTTPTSREDSTSVFDYTDDNLSKEFDYKLVGKTYQQLFYIRSRLSASAKKSEFMCDGVYGCGNSELHCSPPQWV